MLFRKKEAQESAPVYRGPSDEHAPFIDLSEQLNGGDASNVIDITRGKKPAATESLQEGQTSEVVPEGSPKSIEDVQPWRAPLVRESDLARDAFRNLPDALRRK